MPSYSNQAKIEGQIQRALTASELVNLTTKIEGWSDIVSKYLNRYWDSLPVGEESDPEETVRLFDGDNPRELFIDDFSSISKIELLDSDGAVYETLDDEDEWILYPLNKTTKQSIVLRSYVFPKGYSRVRITGIFTSGAVPSAIVEAVTALVANDYLLSEDVGEFESESIEGYSYKIKTQTQADFNTSRDRILQSISGYQKILM